MSATGNCEIPTGDGVSVDDWVVAIDNCAKGFAPCEEEKYWSKTCIYRVPDFIREVKKKAFTPQVVSLGPFHNGAEALMPVEEHKRRALVIFLRRSCKPLSYFMDAVRRIAPELQDCYRDLEQKWRDDVDKFTQLMVLDGCFILESMRSMHFPERDKWHPKGTYATRDPVFGVHGIHHRLPYIVRDMLVLENQIPLKLLKVLLQVEGLMGVDDKSIHEMILMFFGMTSKEVKIDGLALHPLDLYRKCMIQGDADQYTKLQQRKFRIIRPATELREAGITFQKIDEPCYLSSIKFEKGRLHLPVMEVDDYTEFRLLNMIAFEQIHVGCTSKVSAYVSFMDELIDTIKDVKLLEEKGIIRNAHGSRQSVADLFNGLSAEVTLTPGLWLEQVRKSVDHHCKKKWNKHVASLRHTYFHSPWSSISLVGAILVILLTASQTAYTILQYYHPH